MSDSIEVIPVGDISDDEYGISTAGKDTSTIGSVDIESYANSISSVANMCNDDNSQTHAPEDTTTFRGVSPTVTNSETAAESEVNLTPKPVKKKATKRGLAKKISNSDSESSLTHRDIYSKPVNTMKLLYEQNPAIAEEEVAGRYWP